MEGRMEVKKSYTFAELVESKEVDLEAVQKELRNCRNELCLKCGRYSEKHLGACNGCRYDW